MSELVIASSLVRRPIARGGPTPWNLGIVAIVLMFVTAPLPAAISAIGLVALLIVVVVAALKDPTSVFGLFSLLCLATLLWWLLLLGNLNVVSVEGALLGYRMSMVFVLGLLLGVYWPANRASPLRVVWVCVMIMSALSIIVFLFFPQIEQSIGRAAGEYTATFAGQRRLQGLYSGPFHAALAGAFLTLSSLRIAKTVPSRLFRWMGFITGVLCLYLAQVRVGIVATLVGFAVILLTSRSIATRVRRFFFIVVALVTVAVAFPQTLSVFQDIPLLGSLENVFGDTRFLGRVTTWDEALQMLNEHPWFGWGPGSAGATLAGYFPPGGHVTSHNMLLKYGVEGGFPGLVLFVAILVYLFVVVVALRNRSAVGPAALVPLIVFGITGSTVDTLPVSFGLAVVLGYHVHMFVRRKHGDAPIKTPGPT